MKKKIKIRNEITRKGLEDIIMRQSLDLPQYVPAFFIPPQLTPGRGDKKLKFVCDKNKNGWYKLEKAGY